MNKTALTFAVIAAVISPDLLAVDMTNVAARATDLNMSIQDYTLSMAIAGTLSGALLGLFIWKVK
jgi:uncharacterized membrane protein